MRKRTRLFILLVVVGLCLGFLYPTVYRYFLQPDWEKDLSVQSRNQIQEYSEERSGIIINAIRDLYESDPNAGFMESIEKKIDSPVFKEKDPFSFLIKITKVYFNSQDISFPKELTVKKFVDVIPGKVVSLDEALKDLQFRIEKHFADQAFKFKTKAGQGVLTLGLDLSGGTNVVLNADFTRFEEGLERSATSFEKEEQINAAIEILNERIDKFGLTEPVIRPLGNDKIEVEIPGTSDEEIVNTFLRGKGDLKFVLLDIDAGNTLRGMYPEQMDENGNPLPVAYDVAGRTVLPMYEKNAYQKDVFLGYHVIIDSEYVDGNYIVDAKARFVSTDNRTYISVTLDNTGAEIMERITGDNKNGRLAVVLDDKIRASMTISGTVGKYGQVAGFEGEEARALAKMLRTGAMKIDLEKESQNTRSADMGEAAISQGINALLIGFLAVIIFMLLYYKGTGIISGIALVLNVFFIVSVLSVLSLTLTLTSMAALILTIGMAVDANVIIFERIKEEYRLGKSAEASVKAGFQKAFWTIVDANITTLIAAIILMQLGTGAVKGFATTLAVGIVFSMFTALFVSRLMFDFGLETLKLRKLSISWRKK